jgi:hypothetical protein
VINLNEPDIKYHHQLAFMRFDTDAFYPTVNSYKNYQRKLRKTIVKMKNNESHWKANARKEVVSFPKIFHKSRVTGPCGVNQSRTHYLSATRVRLKKPKNVKMPRRKAGCAAGRMAKREKRERKKSQMKKKKKKP